MGRREWDYSLDTSVPAARVLAVLTDFSDDRPRYWPALSRRQYKVLERGDKSALVREGTSLGWAIEKYDWSQRGVVRWTCQESNLANPGTTWEMRVTAIKGGGSHIDVHFERDYRMNPLGIFFQAVISAGGGGELLAGYLQKTLDILEAEQAQLAAEAELTTAARRRPKARPRKARPRTGKAAATK
jgi:hypothetical protein